mmetsp:Transcript_24612/g.57790  ORF Transcript_24612/g.57790 Transcript_24612/m.57790 type:complete len:316 (+) Transcript_24612:344-1291(+)
MPLRGILRQDQKSGVQRRRRQRVQEEWHPQTKARRERIVVSARVSDGEAVERGSFSLGRPGGREHEPARRRGHGQPRVEGRQEHTADRHGSDQPERVSGRQGDRGRRGTREARRRRTDRGARDDQGLVHAPRIRANDDGGKRFSPQFQRGHRPPECRPQAPRSAALAAVLRRYSVDGLRGRGRKPSRRGERNRTAAPPRSAKRLEGKLEGPRRAAGGFRQPDRRHRRFELSQEGAGRADERRQDASSDDRGRHLVPSVRSPTDRILPQEEYPHPRLPPDAGHHDQRPRHAVRGPPPAFRRQRRHQGNEGRGVARG